MAHEILNPLTAVTAKVQRLLGEDATLGELGGFLDGAKEQVGSVPAGAEAAETVGAIREALEEYRAAGKKDLDFIASELSRIQNLVDDMRGATRSTMATIKLSLFELLQYCGEVMSEPVRRYEAKLKVECPPDVYVQADRGELIQVFTNLMRNSLEAVTEAGDDNPRTVELCATLPSEEVVEVRIKDSGPGIPYQNAPLIFEPNFTTKKNGTGLGLPIARRLIRAYGGDLQLESKEEPGQGAVFLVSLPCAVEKPAGWEG